MSRKWRKKKQAAVYAAVAVGAVLLTVALGGFRFFQMLNLKALDAHFVLRSETPTSDIVLLVIDQKALDNIEELQLFWHPYYAEAIRAVADGGARVMGMDVTFVVPVEKWEPDHDRSLAEALAETAPRMPVVCGYVPGIMARQQEWPVPLNIIASALGLAAFVNLTVDSDDFVRKQELIEAPDSTGDPAARSFALRVVEQYLGEEAEFDGKDLKLAGKKVPISPDRAITINYAGPPGTFPRVSLWDFLQAARAGNHDQIRQWVEGKIVLMGPDNIADRYPTPFFTAFSGLRWTTAGVEIHANTIHTLLTRQFLAHVPEFARWAALLAVAGGTVAIVGSLSANAAGFWVLFLIAGIHAITHILFRNGYFLSTSELVLASIFSVLFAVVYRFLTAQKRGELFHKAVSLFVGRHLARSLDESQNISFSAKHEFVTILFSDIRGFTSFCESRNPEEVVKLLNQYLAGMVRIIMNYKGNVNKFLGDGILVIFSDADEGAAPGDHPVRALRCGIEMCSAPGMFRTGVGIHTGVVVQGNVGSADRMEHTVLGDTVNVASRIEGLNKLMKTQLLISEATDHLAAGAVPTVDLGTVEIRGHSDRLRLYTAAALAPAEAAANAASREAAL